ncbi:MAG: hypothetical protein GY832_39915 [Chloroflexi bacterium]|nr:hypothetical protein [Chloroflexota bacterium]
MKKLVLIILLALGFGLMWAVTVSAQEPYPVAVIDQTPTQPLTNPVSSAFQPRYISGFGLDDVFTVFFEDRDNGDLISYNQTTTGPLGFAPTSTATNIIDTHFLVKDWPVTIASTPYAYRGWGSGVNDSNHHFYVSNNLITWTLVSTFTITNTVSFTGARGSVYYGFHDIIELNGTYYAFGESNSGQTMIVSSTMGTDKWFAFDSVGGTDAADGPLHLDESGTPSGSFVPLGENRGYGKIHVRGNDSGFYLAINTAAKPSLPQVDLEATFINPDNWTWNDGATGLTTTLVFSATGEYDFLECWVVPSSDPNADWQIIYDADYGGADGKALGYMGIVPLRPVHHFSFVTIGDQIETRPFTVTITAEDAYGHTVVSYTTPITLTDTTGTINPTLSTSFVNGVLTQTVVITTAQTDVIITATHTTTPTIIGASDPFDVLRRPVTNLDTGERFFTIQTAIDDPNTVAGHTISVTAGVYTENISVDKRVSIVGAGSGDDVSTNTILRKNTDTRIISLTASGLSTATILLQDLRIEPDGVYGIQVPDAASVSYITLDNVQVVGAETHTTESEIGLRVAFDANLSHFTVIDSAFDRCDYGWYFHKHGDWDPGTGSNVTYITVTNTTFNDNDFKGIYVEKLSDAIFKDCTVDNNGRSDFWNQIWNGGFDINLKGGDYRNLTFRNMTVTNNGLGYKEGAGFMIKARDDYSTTYETHPATLITVTIDGGTFSGNERGIRFGEPDGNNATPSNVQIHNAVITGNLQVYTDTDGSEYGGIVNHTQSQVDATLNYWGPDGPSGAGAGSGDAVTSDVTFCPWLGSPGGEPTSNGSLVANLSTGEVFCTIQTAIDDAETQNTHTISATVGTYTENITVTKGITITGVSSATTVIDGGGVGNAVTIITDNVTLVNFTVRGGYDCGGGGPFAACGGVVVDSGDDAVFLTGVSITDNTVVSNTGSGVFVTRADGVLIENNVIHDNGFGGGVDPIPSWAGINLNGGAWGTSAALVRNTTIRENNVYSNTDYGVYAVYGVQDSIIEDNRIHDNSKYGIQIIRFTTSEPVQGNVIRSNQIFDNNRNGVKLVNSVGIRVLTNTIVSNGWGHTKAKYQYGVMIEGYSNGAAYDNLFQGNQFVNNKSGGLILQRQAAQSITNTILRYNTFITSSVAISNNVPYTVTATYNDWGITDLAAIEDKIYHQVDDPAMGEVFYYGFALTDDGSNPMADWASYATVTATLTGLLNPSGNVVSFTTDLGVLGAITGTADAGGTVTTIITSTTDGTATITGTAGLAGPNPMSDTTQVTFTLLTLDHFNFDAILDQTAGVGFPVTVSARDAADLALTDFNGWATLSDVTMSLAPTTAVQFHDGLWSGMVTITQAYVGDVITATYVHDVGKDGVSNAFDVAHNVATIVTLSPALETITSGQSITYTAWATDTFGNGWDATAETVFALESGAGGSWTGNIYTSQFAGTWVVTATVDSVYGTASLTVTPSGIAGVQVSPVTVDVEEDGLTAVYSVSLNSRPADAVTITITADEQTTVMPVSLTFDAASWNTAQSVTVIAVDDDEVEGAHTSTISHTAASADAYYEGIVIDDVIVTVTDNDAAPVLPIVQFSSAAYSVKETAGAATITITLSTTSTLPVTVTYTTSDGTATAGSDYDVISDTLRFDVGQTSRTFDVWVFSDTLLEGDETVNLVLSDPVNATLGVYEAVLTLVDTVAPVLPLVQFNGATYSVKETAGAATIIVTLSTTSTLPVTVTYATSDGTATAGSDYTAVSDTLRFDVGQTSQTFTVPVFGDVLQEDDETVNLVLSDPVNATLGVDEAVLTIVDNALYLPLVTKKYTSK